MQRQEGHAGAGANLRGLPPCAVFGLTSVSLTAARSVPDCVRFYIDVEAEVPRVLALGGDLSDEAVRELARAFQVMDRRQYSWWTCVLVSSFYSTVLIPSLPKNEERGTLASVLGILV